MNFYSTQVGFETHWFWQAKKIRLVIQPLINGSVSEHAEVTATLKSHGTQHSQTENHSVAVYQTEFTFINPRYHAILPYTFWYPSAMLWAAQQPPISAVGQSVMDRRSVNGCPKACSLRITNLKELSTSFICKNKSWRRFYSKSCLYSQCNFVLFEWIVRMPQSMYLSTTNASTECYASMLVLSFLPFVSILTERSR